MLWQITIFIGFLIATVLLFHHAGTQRPPVRSKKPAGLAPARRTDEAVNQEYNMLLHRHMLSFTRTQQKTKFQLPLAGLSDKSLYRIH